MFDWDRDYDATVRGDRITVLPDPVPPRASGTASSAGRSRRRWSPRLSVTVLAAAAVLAVGGAVTSPPGWLPSLSVQEPQAPVAGAFGAGVLRTAAQPGSPRAPLPPMQVYGPREVEAFRRGVARASDADLRRLAAGLAQDLQAPRPRGFEAHLGDLLALARHELARRAED